MRKYGLSPDLTPSGDWVTLGAAESSRTPEDWVYLGRLSEYGRHYGVRFAVRDEKVVAIFGKRGQGKSFTLGCLLEGLALALDQSSIAHLEHPRACLLFDPLNIFQWIDVSLTEQAGRVSAELSAQVERAREWGLQSTAINAQIFYPAGYAASAFRETAREFRLGVDGFGLDEWAALFAFDMVRDVRGQLVAELHDKVTTSGWVSTKGESVAAAVRPVIADYTACLTEDADVNSGIYTDETLRAVAQRLRSIAGFEVFQGLGTPLAELLRPGSVSVLLMNALPADLRNVVVGVLVRRILASRARASGAQKDILLNPSLSPEARKEREAIVAAAPPKTWIVVDEAQDVIPSERKTAATDSIVKLVKEGRNFGLSFVLTTQQPSSVDARVLSQVETFLIHKLVARSDIDRTLENLKCPIPDEIRDESNAISLSALIQALTVGQVVVSDTFARRCALVEIRPRIGAHGGFEA